MRTSPLILGLDLGTTNVKALVSPAQGPAVGQGTAALSLHPVGVSGVEQELSEIWSATCASIRQAINGIDASRIRAVGISSQAGAMQLMDAHGQLCGRVLSWLDGRGRDQDCMLTSRLGLEWFRKRNRHLGSGLAIGQYLRCQREQPAVLSPPHRVGFVGDLIVERLCGSPVHDGTSAALTLLYNPELRDYDPGILELLQLNGSQLPRLQPARSVAGYVTAAAAAATGLPEGISVSPAIHDQYAAALGIGAVHPGDVMFGAGTAWVLLAMSRQLQEPLTSDAFVCHHVVDDMAGQILSLRNGGSAVQWALRFTGQPKRSVAEVDDLITPVAPGCEGLSCWPFLAPTDPVGLECGTGGRLDHLRLSHTPVMLVRAVIEGLAMELTRFLNLLRQGGFVGNRLIMTGGAAASRVTPQIIADATGMPVACTRESEGSLWGAVILGISLLETQEPLASMSERLALPARRLEPGADRQVYQELYRLYESALPKNTGERLNS